VPSYLVIVNAARAANIGADAELTREIRLTTRAGDPRSAACDVMAGAGLDDGWVGIWTVRRKGPLPGRRRWTGRFGWGDDDGLGGVREPRRPKPSAGSASVTLDLPAA
jgi:hypothetical protein